MKNRIQREQDYWNKCAKDPSVDQKYVCDLSDEEFFDTIGNPKGEVLDLGCGVGRLTLAGYCGVDISEEMIKIARKRRPMSIFRVCDGRSLPFSTDFFNYVFSVLLFQHLPLEGVITYIKETARVLKKGGIFKFQFINGFENEPFSKHHAQAVLEKSLRFNSFKILVIDKSLIHNQWTWIEAKKL